MSDKIDGGTKLLTCVNVFVRSCDIVKSIEQIKNLEEVSFV